MTVEGFQPIFRGDVDLTARSGVSVILGGNGLGKTTLMQALIYALTGGVSEEIEEDKRLRWGHAYFRSRLNTKQLRVARVTVSFSLGKERVHVRRDLTSSQIEAFRSSTAFPTWIDNREAAERALNSVLRDFGGYANQDDFAFMVHRLMYLPESRRLLAWDTNAQTRILMLLNRDLAEEQDFRSRRDQLKKLDSRKRHYHVQLEHAKQALINILDEEDEDSDGIESPEEGAENASEKADTLRLPDLLKELAVASKRRLDAAEQMQSVARIISQLANEVDELQRAADQAEADVVASLLDTEERESNLAVYKLLESGICPCCGTKQKELQSAARQYQRAQRCVLCGSERSETESPELSSVRSQLSEKTNALQANEEAHRILQQNFLQVRGAEDELQAQVNAIRFAQPIMMIPDTALASTTREDLQRRKDALEHDEAELAIQVKNLQAELESEYNSFLRAVAERMTTLKGSYERYASAFLGIPCQLVPEKDPDRLLDLTAFIPEFNGAARPTADSCSEAQRFFLDIAFRMAILDLASEMSGFPSSFICETPENALDVSYVDNVAKMFQAFADRRHSVILSANVQEAGLASRMMAGVPKSERKSRVVNLLEIGQLTSVQRGALPRLRQLARKVTG
jgi:DNA repair exonuclease SbcCD ATPase subunit